MHAQYQSRQPDRTEWLDPMADDRSTDGGPPPLLREPPAPIYSVAGTGGNQSGTLPTSSGSGAVVTMSATGGGLGGGRPSTQSTG